MPSLIEMEFDLIEAESCGDNKEAARLRGEIEELHRQNEMNEIIREVIAQ